MFYHYECDSCNAIIDLEFKMGKNPRTVKCSCGKRAERSIGAVDFTIDGISGSRETTFGEEMKQRNNAAGKHMRERWEPTMPKLVGVDYDEKGKIIKDGK